MAARTNKIRTFLTPGKRVHLVGIGGVSMRPLGLVLQGMGLQVTGSDMNASVSTDELRAQGIRVFIGHSAGNIQGADCIIRTAAAHNDNPEIAAARAAGIPVFERAEAWGVLMQSYENAICISGTHGKTTTTSMVTHILLAAQWDPTVMIGGYLPILHAGHRVGKGNSIVLESCEYCDSFLNFFPTMAVVLNIEADHLDYFHDLAGLVPWAESGTMILVRRLSPRASWYCLMSRTPVNSPWAPAAGWKVISAIPVISHRYCLAVSSTSRQPSVACLGLRGWMPAKPGRAAISSSIRGLYFMVQEPRG